MTKHNDIYQLVLGGVRFPLVFGVLMGCIAVGNVKAIDTDSSTGEVSVEVSTLREQLIEAQKTGDKHALEKAIGEYEDFLGKHPGLRKVLADLKEKDQEINKHRQAAEVNFQNKRYSEAIQEYDKCLMLMGEGENIFSIAKAQIRLEIGRSYQELANRSFENALSGEIPSPIKDRLRSQIKRIRQKMSLEEQAEPHKNSSEGKSLK